MIATLGWIILALPLVGTLILALHGAKEPPKAVTRVIGCGSVGLAFVASVVVFIQMLGRGESERTVVTRLWEWIRFGDVSVDLSLRVDPLSVMMMLIITGVGFLIHVYSTEYMNQDEGYRRFFAQMNFFVFAMLLLVLASNVFFLIVGWAFVGLASYLLIGFYYDRPVAVAAAKKAFVINVIGDVGMVIAGFLLVREIGSLDYTQIFNTAPGLITEGSGTAIAIALLLFVGAAAKSAQVPLHTWLPDAMEGPTPVSALIHAATMVTAGVYMVARMHVIYELAPIAMDIVAVVGCVTLVMAATIAIAQEDIKRVLAWSTVSQIGYMIMATGLGAYQSGMFHLLTHAFFKALLFLAAGAVIHALSGEQSLDRMGRLGKHLRVTYMAFAVGCLAIAGVPGFSGFFSKDEILAHALAHGTFGIVLWAAASLGALLTAFYMFRLLFRTFNGEEPEGGYEHEPHAPGPTIAVPLVILAFLSVVGGWIQVPFGWHLLTDWLNPVFSDSLLDAVKPTHAQEITSIVVSVVVAAIGIGLAWVLFGRSQDRRKRIAARHPNLRGFLEDAWRFDEVYDETIIHGGRVTGEGLRKYSEPVIGWGLITAAREVVGEWGRFLRHLQSGLVRVYALMLMAGLVGVATIFILAGR